MRTLKILCLLLVIVMLFTMASCKGKKVSTDTSSSEEVTTAPDIISQTPVYNFEDLHYADTISKPKIRATFLKSNDTETTLIPVALSGENDIPKVTVSAQWNSENVKIYIVFDHADKINVVIGAFSSAYTANIGETVSVTVTTEQMGLSIVDLGQEIPMTLDIYSGENHKRFDGCILLNDYSVFQLYDGSDYSAAFQKSVQSIYGTTTIAKNSDSGAKAKDGCFLIFDRYSSVGNNYAHLRNLVQTGSNSNLGISAKTILIDFDLNINEMPISSWTYLDESYAYGFSVVLTSSKEDRTAMIGFVNTADGIYAYLNGKTAETSALIYTGKHLGDTFHIGLVWKNTTIDLLIDNLVVGSFEKSTVKRSADLSNNTLSFIWQRQDSEPTSSADNFSARIDNLSMATMNGSSVLDGFTADDLLSSEAKLVDGNDGIFLADRNLTLPASAESRKYGLTATVVWQSSNGDVIASDGVLTNPQTIGEFVAVHAYLINGDVIVSEKSFPFFVKALTPSTNVLWKKYDVDPVMGSGVSVDAPYIADDTFNSIIYDMGSIASVNYVKIDSLNHGSRITKNYVALYESNDNASYQVIPEFSIFQNGNELYFYNFSVQARYLKVHFTYETSPSSNFALFNSLQKQMVAYYSESPLLSGDGTYAKSTSITVQNKAEQTLYNKIESYTFADLGISKSDLKSDLSDIRFRCNGKELPHYYSNGTFFVRIFEIPVGGSVDINVLYGNASAKSVANGAETFEIEYGSKVTTIETAGASWVTSVEQMPDGSLITIGNYTGKEHLGIRRSYDGGHTWSKMEQIVYTTNDYTSSLHKVDDSGGFIVDKETGTVYFFCFQTVSKTDDKRLILLVSKDSGKTWERRFPEMPEKTRFGSYSDGIKLSCFDGAGPNVDYVFSIGIGYSTAEFVTTAIYSKDGGETWQLSDSRIDYNQGNYEHTLTYEMGVSEETLLEMSDGSLIMYARCQVPGVLHFAVSHSYDHGVTWEENAIQSNVYASNTQPILIANGEIPVLMWGGNNVLGPTSYCRYPMSLAYSLDNGLTFSGILDASHQTATMSRSKNLYSIVNPDIVIFERGGVKCAYILSTRNSLLIENFDDYLYKTKGAFDSFEIGSIVAEGWVSVSDADTEGSVSPMIVKTGATDGDYALRIGANNKLSRSIPQVSVGTVSFDLYVESLGSMVIELQTAYHPNSGVCAPITLSIDENGSVSYLDVNGNKQNTGLTLKTGDNHIAIDFNGEKEIAILTVNDQTQNIVFRSDFGNYICYAYIYTNRGTLVNMDSFTVIDMD